mgnify:FL=1
MNSEKITKIKIIYQNKNEHTEMEYEIEDGYEKYLALARILGLMSRQNKN